MKSPKEIDLNRPFSKDDVASLLVSVKDDRHWALVVSYAGRAFLCEHQDLESLTPQHLDPNQRENRNQNDDSDEVGGRSLAEIIGKPEDFLKGMDERRERDSRLTAEKSDLIYFRFETFLQGNGYVGRAASNDVNFVARITEALRSNFPYPSTYYIDSL